MNIILTSFRDTKNYPDSYPFSIARFQPRGFMLPSLKFLAPFRRDGSEIKHIPPDEYRLTYETEVLSPSDTFQKTTEALESAAAVRDTILLCCWCTPERQKKYEKLMCHRILVGYWLEERTSVNVIYADGAENPIWKRT